MLRFESSLYFGNAERFRNALVDVTGRDPSVQQKSREEVKPTNENFDENAELIGNENSVDEGIPNGVSDNLVPRVFLLPYPLETGTRETLGTRLC